MELTLASLYGVGPLDDQDEGVSFEMKAGDIAVHAAGVAHRNTESSPDYEYMGVYPKVRTASLFLQYHSRP